MKTDWIKQQTWTFLKQQDNWKLKTIVKKKKNPNPKYEYVHSQSTALTAAPTKHTLSAFRNITY